MINSELSVLTHSTRKPYRLIQIYLNRIVTFWRQFNMRTFRDSIPLWVWGPALPLRVKQSIFIVYIFYKIIKYKNTTNNYWFFPCHFLRIIYTCVISSTLSEILLTIAFIGHGLGLRWNYVTANMFSRCCQLASLSF